MRKINGLTVAVAAAAIVLGASAFADSRPQNESWRGAEDRGAYRNDERVTMEGRIRSLDRDRDGYRVELDRGGYSFFVPERYLRERARDFRVGISVRLGGVFRGGSIFVDAVEFPGSGRAYEPYYEGRAVDRGFVHGVVERVEYRRNELVLRDETGRFITVEMRGRVGRDDRGLGLDDLRRGDRVTLAGDWAHGVFVAYRVESVRSGRW